MVGAEDSQSLGEQVFPSAWLLVYQDGTLSQGHARCDASFHDENELTFYHCVHSFS